MSIGIRTYLLTLWLPLFCQVAYCDSLWSEFLHNPNENTASILHSSIVTDTGTCNKGALPTRKESHRLLTLIREGNSPAFRTALLISNCLGVGDLEDLYRAAGVFLEREPKKFLQIVDERKVSDGNLRYMTTMLPLNLVDNITGKISAIKTRIARTESVNDAPLASIQAEVLTFLRAEQSDLEGMESKK
jgi:hypothetical protein